MNRLRRGTRGRSQELSTEVITEEETALTEGSGGEIAEADEEESPELFQKAKAAIPNVDISEVSVDVLRERRYLWTARAFAIVSAVALCLNLILLVAIGALLPLKRVEPFLLTFQNKNEQVVKIQPLAGDMRAQEILSEAMIRQYVLLRNTMISDVDEMIFRWGPDGPIRWMSSNKVFNDFNKTVKDWLGRIKLEGLTREVRIESVVPNQNLWFVYIETRDMLPEAEEPALAKWLVKVQIRYFAKDQNEVKFVDRLKNPLGFSVVGYSIESVTE